MITMPTVFQKAVLDDAEERRDPTTGYVFRSSPTRAPDPLRTYRLVAVAVQVCHRPEVFGLPLGVVASLSLCRNSGSANIPGFNHLMAVSEHPVIFG